MSIIRRHEALSVTKQELRRRSAHAEEEVARGSQQLQGMKREHSVKKLVRHGQNGSIPMLNKHTSGWAPAPCSGLLTCFRVSQMGIKELSELQAELDSLKEENEQMEDKLLMEHGLSREKVCEQVS